jgi:uncharacterized protein (TIGR02266 family)
VTQRRLDPRAPIQVRVIYESESNLIVDYTANVSKSGLFILTSDPLAVGSLFSIVLRLANDPVPFHLAAEVRWSGTSPEGQGMGVMLHWSDEQQRVRFARGVGEIPESV